MHDFPLIRDLAIILGVASLVALLFHKIRQPVVLGYILAGIIIGPHTPPFPLVSDPATIQTWAELGVIFLMFSLGLEFSFRKLISVGLSAGVTACFEVFSIIFLVILLTRALGYSSMDSVFIGAMLSISSTTIIIKSLTELKLKSHRFAEMILAMLIVEDLIAILVLVALSTIAITKTISGFALLNSAAKLILVVGGWFLSGYFLVPRFIRYISRFANNEILTLVSLGLCLALVVFSAYFGYSAALGAFIMGSILSESTESHRIEERMESIRDLFAAIFFVSVGMMIDPHAFWHYRGTILLFSCITIFGKVTLTTLGAVLTGQNLKTSIQMGFGLAQIGEFSFIIAGLGRSLGVTQDFLYPVAVGVSLVTTFLAPYLIRFSGQIASEIESRLPPPLKLILEQYVSWVSIRRAEASKNHELYRVVFKWILNGILVSVIFLSCGEFLINFLELKIQHPRVAAIGAWIITLLFTSPFIWAMLSLSRKLRFREKDDPQFRPMNLGLTLIFQIISLLWVGALSLTFFPAKGVLVLMAVLAISFFALFYRKIENTYHWFEETFVSTFEVKEKTKSLTHAFQHLAPWDAHLARVSVHPNSKLAGMKLADTRIRTRFGISVVAIQRGLRTLVAPLPTELILPKDELVILATDEQLDAIQSEISKPMDLEEGVFHQTTSDYHLRKIVIEATSPLIGETIRTSQIREKFGAMVVGIEREGDRIVNPESDLSLRLNDTVWIVGKKDQLETLISSI